MATQQRRGTPPKTMTVVEGNPDAGAKSQPGDIDLDALVAQRQEALDLEDGHLLHFTWRGHRYTMPYPLFASDEWNEELQSLTDSVDIAVHCLGEDQYEQFKADDGKAGFVAFLLQEANSKVQSAGEENPTRLNRSSRRTLRPRR